MTKFSVLAFPMNIYIIGCLEVPEMANLNYEKKNDYPYRESLV